MHTTRQSFRAIEPLESRLLLVSAPDRYFHVASTKVDGQSPWRGGIWLAAATLTPLLAGAMVSVVLGRFLGPDELGQQSYIAFVQALLSALLVGSLFSLWVRQISEARAVGDMAMVEVLSRQANVAGLVGGGISVVVLLTIGLRSDDIVSWVACAIWALANAAALNYGARTVAAFGWAAVSRHNIIWQSVAPVLAVLAVLAGWGVAGVFVAYAFSETCLALVIRRSAPRVERGPRWPLQPGITRLAMAFMVQAALKAVVFNRIELFFLARWQTDTQIAMFSVAFMIVNAILLIPGSLIGSAFPTIVRAVSAGDSNVGQTHLKPAARVIAAGSAPLAVITATLVPPFIVWLYGDAFTDAAAIVPILALSCLVFPVATLCQTYWSARGRLRPITVAMIVGGIADLGLSITLIKSYGVWGAAMANTAGQVGFSLVVVGYTWSRTPKPRDLFGRVWVAVAASAVMAAGNLVGLRLLGGLPGVFVFTVLDFIFLFGANRLFGMLTANDERWLLGLSPAGIRRRLQPLAHWGPAEPVAAGGDPADRG